MLDMIIKLLRIKHYIKNIVVFLPLIFTFRFTNLNDLALSIIIFIAFSLISSAVYIMNDIVDINSDKMHYQKKSRPIANGDVSIFTAKIYFILLTILSLSISFTLSFKIVVIVLIYLLLNMLYSYKLKFLPIVDAFCIACGFTLRILAGYTVLALKEDYLAILLVFFTSLFFTFIKRKLEYIAFKNKDNLRTSIKDYNCDLINQYITINAVMAIMFYFLYTFEQATILTIGTSFLYITGLLFTFFVFRLLFLANLSDVTTDPTVFIYQDKIIRFIIVTYFLAFCYFIMC